MLTIDENFKINVGVRLKQLRENKHYTINKLLEIMQNDYYVEIDEKSIRRYERRSKGILHRQTTNYV